MVALGALFIVLIVLMISEYLWRKKKLSGEGLRKFVHITVGSFAAFWPHFMSFPVILLISFSFLVVVLVLQRIKLFHAINGSTERTMGEIFFAFGIGLAAVLASAPWVFTIAILHLSIADGFAGLIGSKWGKRNSYQLAGHTKSLAGTLTFYIISLSLISIAVVQQPSLHQYAWQIVAVVPLLATLTENIGIYGTDNVLIPLVVIAALASF